MTPEEFNYRNEILKQHLEQVRAYLRDLNYNFGLNYVFAYGLRNNISSLEFLRGFYYNRLFNLKWLNDVILDLIELKRETYYWLNLINEGKQVVYCTQATNYPGDNCTQGKMYLINHMVVEGATMRYVFNDMDSGLYEGGFDYNHFIRLFSQTSKN